MIKKFYLWLCDQARWNELGHAFMGFIFGMLNIYMMVGWILFAMYDELINDKHIYYFYETKDEQLDMWFDLQSKILSSLLGYSYIHYILWKDSLGGFLNSLIVLSLLLFIGYKGPWFYSDVKK